MSKTRTLQSISCRSRGRTKLPIGQQEGSAGGIVLGKRTRYARRRIFPAIVPTADKLRETRTNTAETTKSRAEQRELHEKRRIIQEIHAISYRIRLKIRKNTPKSRVFQSKRGNFMCVMRNSNIFNYFR